MFVLFVVVDRKSKMATPQEFYHRNLWNTYYNIFSDTTEPFESKLGVIFL
jgi:hypothetical protein